MKNFFSIFVLLILFALLLSCGKKNNAKEEEKDTSTNNVYKVEVGKARKEQKDQIEVNGQAASGIYTSPMSGGGREYHVWIKIKNLSKKPLMFQKIETFWFSSGGGLPQITKKEKAMFIINSGESDEFHFSTNGYTTQILRAALDVNEPVKFSFYLTINEQIVSKKYVVVLPSLDVLPRHLYSERQGKEFYKLHFTTTNNF